jgi:hypothetical protein
VIVSGTARTGALTGCLSNLAKNRRVAQKRYREFVRDGIANRPWDNLKGQIYLGSEEFIEKHSAENKELKEIPRAQGEKGDRLLFLAILATVYDELLSCRLATLVVSEVSPPRSVTVVQTVRCANYKASTVESSGIVGKNFPFDLRIAFHRLEHT